ncbi:PolC-type DNA polymerase III [Flagellimonas nanhaiensis]|uniref:3'-5' exonuclease n=1 Tax=Flagellimonas nanhaiensis TaxID=2292706 RepID=A0A371JVZ4_9FLAO|nr:3'-5' exonuclease [Allomuricauda nanhaiensis]RDY61946.1 3'-5' exonuclease [Allomuricauda nanhaiensis]
MGKAKTYPDFWLSYEASLKTNLPSQLEDNIFVVLDTETTGLDIKKDRILSIGALTIKNSAIKANEAIEVFVQQERYSSESAKIHGILKKDSEGQLTELEALQKLLKMLKGAIIVAHHAKFDVTMINNALKRNGLPKLMNKSLDTSTLYSKTLSRRDRENLGGHFSLDHLAHEFNVPKGDRHTALGDAYITAVAFLHIISKLKPASLNNLLKKDRFWPFW